MTHVYILMADYGYEGREIIEIFDHVMKAEAALAAQASKWYVSVVIEEWPVTGDDVDPPCPWNPDGKPCGFRHEG
jgi:hypothetical protein